MLQAPLVRRVVVVVDIAGLAIVVVAALAIVVVVVAILPTSPPANVAVSISRRSLGSHSELVDCLLVVVALLLLSSFLSLTLLLRRLLLPLLPSPHQRGKIARLPVKKKSQSSGRREKKLG